MTERLGESKRINIGEIIIDSDGFLSMVVGKSKQMHATLGRICPAIEISHEDGSRRFVWKESTDEYEPVTTITHYAKSYKLCKTYYWKIDLLDRSWPRELLIACDHKKGDAPIPKKQILLTAWANYIKRLHG